MNRLLFLCLVLFCSFAMAEGKGAFFNYNVDDAQKLVNGRCRGYLAATTSKISKIFTDEECDAASKIVEEAKSAKSIDLLIASLEKFLKKLPAVSTYSEDEKVRYALDQKRFSEDESQVDPTVESCLSERDRALYSHSLCRAAVVEMIGKLQKEQERLAKPQNREYYIRLFSANADEIVKSLEGRCRKILADPWYNSSNAQKDVECDTALYIRSANAVAARDKELEKNHKEVKDKAYFIKNIKDAEKLSGECRDGKIENLDECESAMYVVTEKNGEESKREGYVTYYNGHPLAAKFFLRWCKNSMLNFDIKCQAAESAVKKYSSIKKPKTYKEELFDKDVAILKDHPEKAKELLQGKCKALFADPWYYLDEYIRSEQCDAAAEIARLMMENENSKKADAEKAAAARNPGAEKLPGLE